MESRTFDRSGPVASFVHSLELITSLTCFVTVVMFLYLSSRSKKNGKKQKKKHFFLNVTKKKKKGDLIGTHLAYYLTTHGTVPRPAARQF
jgi:hypothetical protein